MEEELEGMTQLLQELHTLDRHFRDQGAGGVADVIERCAVQLTGLAPLPQDKRLPAA